MFLLLACAPPPHVPGSHPEQATPWTHEGPGAEAPRDVVIVGGGPAGLAVASRLDHGLLLEGQHALGGRILTGAAPEMLLVGTPEQALRGIDDDVDQAVAQWSSLRGTPPTDLTLAFLEDSGEVRDRLVEAGLQFPTLTRSPRAEVPRQHLMKGSAHDFVQALTAGVTIEARTQSWVQGLELEDGRVVGVRVDDEVIHASRVVIAVGGFSGSPELLEELGYDPTLYQAEQTWTAGDHLGWAEEHGLGLGHLDAVGWHPALAAGEDPTAIAPTLGETFWVDVTGRRFADETQTQSVETASVVFQTEHVAIAACERIQDWKGRVDRGEVEWFETADDLAAAHDVDPDGLHATLADLAWFADEGEVDAWGRKDWPEADLGGALCTYEIGFRASKAFGGLQVDAVGRVLDVEGVPVPGLYAVGEAAGMAQPGLGGLYGFDGSMSAILWGGWRLGDHLAR